LSELNPPRSYTLTGEGSGGAAGFAKGQAQVALTAEGDQTLLQYSVKASIGGKLAQIGQRLVDGAAKKMADEFFDKFAELAGGKVAPPPAQTTETSIPRPANDNQGRFAFEPPTWVPVAIIGSAILFLLVILLS
jgi:hypothetical protein